MASLSEGAGEIHMAAPCVFSLILGSCVQIRSLCAAVWLRPGDQLTSNPAADAESRSPMAARWRGAPVRD